MLGQRLEATDEEERDRDPGDQMQHVDALHTRVVRRGLRRSNKLVRFPSISVREPVVKSVTLRSEVPADVLDWVDRQAVKVYKSRSRWIRDHLVALKRQEETRAQ